MSEAVADSPAGPVAKYLQGGIRMRRKWASLLALFQLASISDTVRPSSVLLHTHTQIYGPWGAMLTGPFPGFWRQEGSLLQEVVQGY